MPFAGTSDGIRIYYEEHGPAESGRSGTRPPARAGRRTPTPLVLAYGIGGNTDMWAPNTPGLAAGRRVIQPDRARVPRAGGALAPLTPGGDRGGGRNRPPGSAPCYSRIQVSASGISGAVEAGADAPGLG
jgi:pimeloyl-ACP methyl ester carboxylesterase